MRGGGRGLFTGIRMGDHMYGFLGVCMSNGGGGLLTVIHVGDHMDS